MCCPNDHEEPEALKIEPDKEAVEFQEELFFERQMQREKELELMKALLAQKLKEQVDEEMRNRIR